MGSGRVVVVEVPISCISYASAFGHVAKVSGVVSKVEGVGVFAVVGGFVESVVAVVGVGFLESVPRGFVVTDE